MHSNCSIFRRNFMRRTLASLMAIQLSAAQAMSVFLGGISIMSPTDNEIEALKNLKAKGRTGGGVLNIRNRIFEDTPGLDGSSFIDVVFYNCNFINVKMGFSTLKNARFEKCRFIDVEWDFKHGADLTMVECEFHGSGNKIYFEASDGQSHFDRCRFEGFEKSGALGHISTPGKAVMSACEFRYMRVHMATELEFQDCQLSMTDVVLSDGVLAGQVALTKCSGQGVDFINHFSDIRVRDCDFDQVGLSRVTLKNLKLQSSAVELQLLGLKAETFLAERCTFRSSQPVYDPVNGGGILAEQVDVTSFSVVDCIFEGANAELFAKGSAPKVDANGAVVVKRGVSGRVIPYHATFGKVVWRNTPMTASEWRFASVGSLTIEDSTVSDSNFTSADIGELVFKNVRLAGTVDFSNAKVKKTTAQGVIRDPKLKLVTAGSSLALSL